MSASTSVSATPGRQKLILALEDGKAFFGHAVALPDPPDAAPSAVPPDAAAPRQPDQHRPLHAQGELVFCTGMTGYQELCSDPSYRGQIVVLTYPLINNYGVNPADRESTRPWLHALVVREYCPQPSNWRATQGLAEWLADYGIPICAGIDTRALTRHLRTHGAMRAVLAPPSPGSLPPDGDAGSWLLGRTPGTAAEVACLVQRARGVLPLSEQALVAEVAGAEGLANASPSEPYDSSVWAPFVEPRRASRPHRVVLIDCGVKHNIARSLPRRGLDTIIVPYNATIAEIEALHPDGVVIGNGPGDPDGDPSLKTTIDTLRHLIEGPVRRRAMPLTAVCLGHQVLGLAIGGQTSRLKFGHRGANHPVQDVRSGRVYITSQNHGFQVDATSIPPKSGFVVSHVNLNDGSVEGLEHKELPVFTVQYHPEASPGPQDNQYLFDRFVDHLEDLSRA
ncbi:MAG: glutamine-hydrolyzing carbamoyl-phosphate synthase small subunit [Chloroflexota bacterium]|nr:glutamine-hydrolyzing carbamoyl-phosphate synthase small subunit [Chloroflexota bacterium]